MSERADIVERLRKQKLQDEMTMAEMEGDYESAYDPLVKDCREAADEIDRLRQQNEDLMVMVHGETEKVSALTARCAQLEKALDAMLPERWADPVNKGMPDFETCENARLTLQGQDNGR